MWCVYRALGQKIFFMCAKSRCTVLPLLLQEWALEQLEWIVCTSKEGCLMSIFNFFGVLHGTLYWYIFWFSVYNFRTLFILEDIVGRLNPASALVFLLLSWIKIALPMSCTWLSWAGPRAGCRAGFEPLSHATPITTKQRRSPLSHAAPHLATPHPT
jgi:hypothetical protein